ncbi:hypothetical protein RJ639_007741 [Escallonia herrerae]|uniref:N-acetyltransferase domain-containing protein n=1 Tax=Escallonia herrerae TaxID=1293975 RepID=A0AA89AV68_9ASTE|nr:hypothetical protein RJ639_007741 [Escallonia herrerae]
MATTVSLPRSLDTLPHHHHRHLHRATHCKSNRKHAYPFVIFPKSARYTLTLCSSTSPPSPSPTPPPAPPLENPLPSSPFLSNQDLASLQNLQNFMYFQKLKSGSLLIRVMKEHEMDMTVGLLSESFAESMLLPAVYVTFLGFLVKQYLIERRALMPHTATLIGFFKGDGEKGDEGEVELAGTVEVSFDKLGANASPPTPTPPKNSPYICNMTVNKPLRRKGIGWHLLKASEELISQMSSSGVVYLHCRMIDAAPLNMYTKAGYSIVETDSILILLTLQRRKHLMCKQLPVLNSPSESSVLDPIENQS